MVAGACVAKSNGTGSSGAAGVRWSGLRCGRAVGMLVRACGFVGRRHRLLVVGVGVSTSRRLGLDACGRLGASSTSE